MRRPKSKRPAVETNPLAQIMLELAEHRRLRDENPEAWSAWCRETAAALLEGRPRRGFAEFIAEASS